jgi:hypothetical protein
LAFNKEFRKNWRPKPSTQLTKKYSIIKEASNVLYKLAKEGNYIELEQNNIK